MRAKFWRKKNPRLIARVNSVIETSERMRKSLPPVASRVMIDTSYLDMVEEQQAAHGEDGAYDELQPDDGHGGDGGPDDRDPIEASHFDELDAFDIAASDARRADARHVAAALRDKAARKAAEAEIELQKLRDDSMTRELEARAREEAARQAAEAERAELTRQAAEAERELAELRAVSEERERIAREESEAGARKEAARLAAEAERAALARQAAEAERQLAEMRAAAEERERIAREASEARAREEAARLAAEAERAELARQAAEAERQLAEMRAAAAERERIAREESEARAREEAARQAAEAERAELARQAAEAERQLAEMRAAAEERERTAREESDARALEQAANDEGETEDERAEIARRAADAERQLAEMRVAAEKRERSAYKEAEARARNATGGLALNRSASPAQEQPVAVNSEEISTGNNPLTSAQPATRVLSVAAAANVGSGNPPASEQIANKRRERRLPSQMPATLWREGVGHLACTLRDRSSSGARLEFRRDQLIDGLSELAVGNTLTLNLTSAQEKTSVPCVVVWVAGNRCGVRFSGQFKTEAPAPRRSIRQGVDKIQSKPTGSRWSLN